ncbi:hypothetical protein D3C71_2056720 [compost metagenome]
MAANTSIKARYRPFAAVSNSPCLERATLAAIATQNNGKEALPGMNRLLNSGHTNRK